MGPHCPPAPYSAGNADTKFFPKTQAGRKNPSSDQKGTAFAANTPVYNTKSIVFDSYGDIPIGEAADQNLSAVKWASERNNDGSYTVTVRGISEKYSTRIGIDFNYSEDSDYCWANAEAAFANGSYFYDDLSIAAAMAMIYGDNDTVDAALLWSMLE